MENERWQRLWGLFHEALAEEVEDPVAYLGRICDDGELRREVAELLAAHEREVVWLDEPIAVGPLGEAEREEEIVGLRVGPYTVQGVLGSGGLGVVYDAIQEGPLNRRVALKLIKPGMDTAEVLSRFDTERRALALMRHPGIARVFDAGSTESGRPYFVMERVEGEPINTYADRRRLGLRERLELLAQTCDALQHAHQKGIIHRDVKPSNVLVTEEAGGPAVKIIDFGIAKAMQPDGIGGSLATSVGGFLGTPEYASPEQAAAGPEGVDVRTDVYACGVLLYELLCGRLPFSPGDLRRRDVDGMRRLLSSVEPPSPSRALRETPAEDLRQAAERRGTTPAMLRRRLGGELDWITRKAMAKDPADRYAGAGAFADDLRRYLTSEPVLAGPPTTRYRLGKFLRRHRLGVAASAVALVGLNLFTALTVVQSHRLRSALGEAEAERRRSAEAAELLVGLFELSDPERSSAAAASAREILDRGAERLLSEPVTDAELRAELLTLASRISSNLGLYGRAVELARRALELRRQALGDEHPLVARSLSDLAEPLLRQEAYDEVEIVLQRAIALQRELPPSERLDLAASLDLLGELIYCRGDYDGAERRYREALAIRRQLLGDGDPRLAEPLQRLARLALDRGDLERSSRLSDEALRLRREAGAADLDLADSLSSKGASLVRLARFEEAEVLLDEALALQLRVLGSGHERLTDTLNNLALVHSGRGDHVGAADLYRRALEIAVAAHGPDHADSVGYRHNLAVVLMQQGKLSEARPLLEEAISGLRRVHGEEHPQVAYGMLSLATLLHRSGELAAARLEYEGALRIAEQELGESHPLVASICHGRASLELAAGEVESAERLLRRAVEVRRAALDAHHPELARALVDLSRLLVDRQEWSAAQPLLVEGVEIRRQALGRGDRRTAAAESLLGEVWLRLGRRDLAEPLLVSSRDTLTALEGSDSPAAGEVEQLLEELRRR